VNNPNKILIIGGGLAGLVSGIRLVRKGFHCVLIEKEAYPFHRVCGEYISNEVKPFMIREKLFPKGVHVADINEFELTSVNGKQAILPLDSGGFGISRYFLDKHLFDIAISEGLEYFREEALSVNFNSNQFEVITNKQEHIADLLICAHGKRSKIDKQLNRAFIKMRSPYVGVKYHVKYDQPENRVSLHNFENGYCGINAVEQGIVNLCYLTHRDNLRQFRSIPEMEKKILYKNPHLNKIFTEAEFLFEKPETINEISFETKLPVEDHCLMLGDAAGMITPLSGNGMSMAMRSAYMLSESIFAYASKKNFDRSQLEAHYANQWRAAFKNRLSKGRYMQRLFGNKLLSQLSVNLALYSRPIAQLLIKQTYGEAF
jgi:menaquinone-9 beta-reductase